MGAMDKLGDMAGGDKVEKMSDQGLERAGDMADERTGGKHGDKIDQAQDAADARLGDEQETQSPT